MDLRTRTRRLRAGLAVLAILGFSLTAAPAWADQAGAKVILQVWNPALPDRNEFRTLYDNATVISDGMGRAWDASRAGTCDNLVRQLGTPNAVIRGATLYDIVCHMGGTGTFKLVGAAANQVKMKYVVSGNFLEFTSTQPTAAGKWADPRFEVRYDLEITVDLAVQNANPVLRAISARAQVMNARPDTHGVIADLVRDFVDGARALFGTPSFADLLSGPINRTNINMTQTMNASLASVNALLSAQPNLVQVGRWVRHGKIILAFTPRVVVPTSGPGGVAGTIRWAKDLRARIESCNVFQIKGAVQTGPAPIIDPDSLSTGAGPEIPVGSLRFGAVADRGDHFECSYSVGGLPVGIPNRFTPGGFPTGGNTFFTSGVSLKFDGWNDTVIPQPLASGKDYKVAGYIHSSGVGVVKDQAVRMHINPGDPQPREQKVAPQILQGVSPVIKQQQINQQRLMNRAIGR